MASRKRRAPGASPQPPLQTYQQDATIPTDQYMNWNDSAIDTDMNAFNDPPLYDYGSNQLGGHNRVVSLDGMNNTDLNTGQLVRRNQNQQLAPRRGQWDGFPSPTQQQWDHVEDEEELEQKAAVAKKDAQTKRKQIPPFVQKLSSFLDNNKNENLIRWSDDGNSFIVLDEDEFARTLIPELFKHNNYASFVRQLNMYGFHKKVGLSDNSMKASETKAKAPSEYFNKYFKRGRPELLWLIQKPKNPASGPKRKREEDGKGDSDEERKYVQDSGGGGYVEELAVRGNDQMAMIPRSEYNSLRVEVRQLQDQQKLISSVLNQIKRQNEELYSRATSFQALHDRHENSINAILTFLATFYNRSLEGNANGMNLSDMFPAARQQPHGNVVDVDDFPPTEMSMSKSSQLQRNKKPLALLPAPPADHLSTGGRATTMSPTTRPTPSPITRPGSRQQSVFKPSTAQNRQQSTANTPHGRDPSYSVPLKVESPSNLTPLPENDAVMSAIQNANANANAGTTSEAPQFDFPAALSDYQNQNGNVPLTTQERSNVLSMMAGNSAASTTNNALTNPNPPEMQRLMEDLSQYQATQKQLEILQQMSDEQNSRVQSLQERLQPLSPSGQIPGLSDGEYFGNAAGLGDPGQYDLDLDSFVQDQDFFPDNANNVSSTTMHNNITHDMNAGLPDFNFENPTPDLNGVSAFDGTSADAFDFGADAGHLNVGAAGGMDDAGFGDSRVESVSSNATSPAATVEEVEDETRRRSPKRRKK
ncbi:heat shock factor protein HSF8 [Paraphoma chrysanthemicola]|uniref:Heat shock factor protein HSF8 n=1 Tax=Paraphoma chrysanthemicola TaxID=798071 RepID=A0A8K0R8S7_9PLEO|nr:heat shock factor protein HSF8 [Paraphoma chrysanthemicola]